MKTLFFFLLLPFVILSLPKNSFSQSFYTIKVRKACPIENDLYWSMSNNVLTFYYPVISCDLCYIVNGICFVEYCDPVNLNARINKLKTGTKVYLDNVRQRIGNEGFCFRSCITFKKPENFISILKYKTDTIVH